MMMIRTGQTVDPREGAENKDNCAQESSSCISASKVPDSESWVSQSIILQEIVRLHVRVEKNPPKCRSLSEGLKFVDVGDTR
jgi:hypothetical protein